MNMECPPRVLTIAGSDSGGGAGIQADLKTFQSFACFGMSAITALTAQNSQGVQGIQKIPAEFVERQIESVLGDIGADAVKCGMLVDSSVIEVVGRALEKYADIPVILDTVLIAKSGDQLLEDSSIDSMVELLFPRALLITPNLDEAERLAGFAVRDLEAMKKAAEKMKQMGARAVLVKGGHLEGSELTDYFLDDKNQEVIYRSARLDTDNTHGTGCTLSSAIAALIARGKDLKESVELAREYLREGIKSAHKTGKGYGTLSHPDYTKFV